MTERGHNPLKASLRRMWLIAGQTLAEALHLRLTLLLAMAGTMLVLTARWLRDFNFGFTELKFLVGFGLGAIGLMGTLLAALATAHLFFSDVAGATIACVLTRPVRRGEFIGGKLAGVMALLAGFVLTLALVLAGLIAVREAQLGVAGVPMPDLGQACALIWLKLTLVAAMTLLVCSYAASPLFASSAGLLLAVVAHLRPFTATTGGLAWMRLWPNLALFDAETLLAVGGLSATGLLERIGYWAVFILLLGGLASHVFRHREF